MWLKCACPTQTCTAPHHGASTKSIQCSGSKPILSLCCFSLVSLQTLQSCSPTNTAVHIILKGKNSKGDNNSKCAHLHKAFKTHTHTLCIQSLALQIKSHRNDFLIRKELSCGHILIPCSNLPYACLVFLISQTSSYFISSQQPDLRKVMELWNYATTSFTVSILASETERSCFQVKAKDNTWTSSTTKNTSAVLLRSPQVAEQCFPFSSFLL